MERSDRAGLSAASNAPVGIEALTYPLSLDEEKRWDAEETPRPNPSGSEVAFGEPAAVDHKVGASDVFRVVGSVEQRSFRHIVRHRGALQRNHRFHSLHEIALAVIEIVVHGRPGRPGADRV